MNSEAITDVNEELVSVNPIDVDVYLATLTLEGVLHVLKRVGVSYEDSLDVLKDIELSEKMQISALLDYLKLEKYLGNKIIYIMLKDARVRTNENMFKLTYSLPLTVILDVIEDTGYKLIDKNTVKAVNLKEDLDYRNFIYLNKQYDKIASLFISIEG